MVERRVKLPNRNAPDQMVPYLKELERRLFAAEAELERNRNAASIAGRAATTVNNFTTDVHNAGNATAAQVAINTADILELQGRAGLPEGAEPHASLIVNRSTSAVQWATPAFSVIPQYFVWMEEGKSGYSVTHVGNISSDESKEILPEVRFDNNGHTMLPITTWDAGRDEGPISLNMEFYPHYDGEKFDIYLPAAGSSYGASVPYFLLKLYNNSSLYSVTVDLWDNFLVYGGTTIPVAGDNGIMTLESKQNFQWFVMGGGPDAIERAVYPLPRVNGSSGASAFHDKQYTLQIKAMERCQAFSAQGELSVAAGAHRFYNDTLEQLRLGQIRATVGTAPTGSDIQIDVKRNGASVFSVPLVIPAGSTTAVATPGVLTHTFNDYGSNWNLALLDPGDYLTVDILAVGSTFAGADLTVQVYYG